MRKLRSRIVPATGVHDRLRHEMFALFSRYYIDVDQERFERDLRDKTHIFLFHDETADELVGFSTIRRERIPDLGPGLFLFSGDTVLRKDCWGSKILQRTFFRFIVESKALTLHQPLYWMLISKGFKTYLMMRRNFRHSYPSPHHEMPERFRQVLEGYYRKHFGESFHAESGLVRHASRLGAVVPGLADPDELQARDPDVAFFLRRNPGYRTGDELACVAEIRVRDFAMHVLKFFLTGARGRPPRAPDAGKPRSIRSA